ncbi:hypothetical protein D3C86_1816460 [compost metagenome]
MHHPIQPVYKAVGIVDLREILRYQELHKAEGELVLGIPHAHAELGFGRAKVVLNGIADNVHPVVDAAANVRQPMREQIEVAQWKAGIV